MKPILFNTDMVRAILDNRKKTTRRAVRPHNRRRAKLNEYHQGDGLWIDAKKDDLGCGGHVKDYSISPCWFPLNSYIEKYAPYRSGDILYVRETFSESASGIVYKADEPDSDGWGLSAPVRFCSFSPNR